MKNDKKWWEKGKNEMSASEDIESEGIKEEPLDEIQRMKEAWNLYDKVIEDEKKGAEQQGREIIEHLKPKIPFIMGELGFSVENYNVTEEIKFIPWRREYHIKSPGHCSAKLYITTEKMKFLFCIRKIYDDFRNTLVEEIPYLVLIGLKCKMCGTWETIPYTDDYMDSTYNEEYAIESIKELGRILGAFPELRCHKCRELILKNIVDFKKHKENLVFTKL